MNKVLKSLIEDPKCLFVHNHSGGKDSDASYLVIKDIVPSNRIIVVHAHLPEVEWEGTEEHIREVINPEHQFYVCQSVKTFFEMVEHRKMFPSPENRQCTSDLKRGPIERTIKGHCNKYGFDKVVNIMGLRAEESSGRKKKSIFKKVKRNCNGKRLWFEWLPIHKMKTAQVFKTIADHGKEAFWVYKAGMKRKSCCFCIMSSKEDLCTAAKLRPELAARYSEVERRLNFSLIMPKQGEAPLFLDEIVNIGLNK